jgi:nucleoside-diphosphate-sugar epimerase
VRAQVRQGEAVGQLVVSLNARPVESYLRVVGRNGVLHADFVLSGLTALPGPGADAVAALLQPYRTAMQLAWHTTKGLVGRVFRRQKSYVGLLELIEAFYASVRGTAEAPVSPEEILNTVDVCEKIADQLTLAQQSAAIAGAERLLEREAVMTQLPDDAVRVLVTGAAGFLGREVVRQLHCSGRYVRAVTRGELGADSRQAGVDYVVADLAEAVSADLLENIDAVVHLAAETAGDKALHERNTLDATAELAVAAAAAGVATFINTSSIAVHLQGADPVAEDSPLVVDESRGPYVWAKSLAETRLQERLASTAMCFRNLRLGPLVDDSDFAPPGRLGREVGPFFVAPGASGDVISLCTIQQAAEVIDYALDNLALLPTHVNLVDPASPTRRQLLKRVKASRPYLFILRVPGPLLTLLSGAATLVQKYVLRKDKVLDVASAFRAQRYDSTVAAGVLEDARRWHGQEDPYPPPANPIKEQNMQAAIEAGR